MSDFEQMLRKAGIDTAADAIGLDFSLYTKLGMAERYQEHHWSVIQHPLVGAVINAVPRLENPGLVPWEEWFRRDGELRHHILYTVKQLESTDTWQGEPNDLLHPSQVLGPLWYVQNDSDSTPVRFRSIEQTPGLSRLFPEAVAIDSRTGSVEPSTGRYATHLSHLRGLFHDDAALDRAIAEGADPLAYEVIDYRKAESDFCFGTTIMMPGRVGEEFYMTRGHFHARKDRGEAYYTQSGEGLLLLESRDGEIRKVEMRPGVCAFIPPDWAHRSVNTCAEKLVFVWFCATDAGYNYGAIRERGMRKLVVERNGMPALVDNPNFA